MNRTQLERKALAELREIASALDLRGYQRMKKADLVALIIGAGDAGASSDPTPAERPVDGPGGGAATAADTDGSTSEPSTSGDDAGGVAAGRDNPMRTRARARTGETDRRPAGAAAGTSRDNGRDNGRGPDAEADVDADADAGDDIEAGSGDDGEGGDGALSPGRAKRERRRKNRGQGAPTPGQGGDPLEDAEVREGVLDLLPEGYGFLRTTGYLAGDKDVYVSQSYVRRFDLRRGDRVRGPIRRNKNNDKFPALGRVELVEGQPAHEIDPAERRPDFKDLTPRYPDQGLRLAEGDHATLTTRLVDLVAPIGKGDRVLLVAPPRAGTSALLTQIATSIEAAEPDVHLMVLLVDERPEEIAEMRRVTDAEVIATSFDRPAEDHVGIAELTIERAKRLAERGEDVVLLLDSITRLARAYDIVTPTSGRTTTAGVDAAALYPPKRFFAAARNLDEAGSITIVAAATVGTGSLLDEAVAAALRPAASVELRIDRDLVLQRFHPAVDVRESGNRNEEQLRGPDQVEGLRELRRQVAALDPASALRHVVERIETTADNDQLLRQVTTAV